MGVGIVLLVLVFFFGVFNFYTLKTKAYNVQLAADSMSDAIAIFGYSERGTYDEALKELDNVKDMIMGSTSLLPSDFNGTVTLDRDMYEDEDIACVTVAMKDNPVISLFGDSFTITRDSKTYFPKKSISNIYTGFSDIPYIQWCINIANDNTHGYSMTNRGGNPDYDCSSFVCSSLKYSGMYPTAYAGATTGSMASMLLRLGFEQHAYNIDELQEGDILLSPRAHTEIYVGESNGQKMSIGAHNDHDGNPGDSSGNEISVVPITRTYQYYFRDPNLAGKIASSTSTTE